MEQLALMVTQEHLAKMVPLEHQDLLETVVFQDFLDQLDQQDLRSVMTTLSAAVSLSCIIGCWRTKRSKGRRRCPWTTSKHTAWKLWDMNSTVE